MDLKYDVIVVGAGHAGCEAASAAALMGSKVLLITMDMTKIAQMSCNPAMGGIAKGQIVREIDALGGFSGIVTDRATIQFRMLNKSKGPAMWSPRAQCDRMIFYEEWRKILETNPNIDFWQDSVVSLVYENNCICGVKTKLGVRIGGRSVIITAGTFLNGLMHIGKTQIEGGRTAELPSLYLADQISDFGIRKGRLKTGTPPRIDGRTVNFSVLNEQAGDIKPSKFSYSNLTSPVQNQMSCYITYTNEKVHEILRSGIKVSPLFDGTIQSTGPRYCPSIESKIIIFADKERHQLFLEPEGRNTNEYYLQGFSSSLPLTIQIESIHQIRGLEECKIFRPAYAIEYDYFDPTQLKHSLESRIIENLFFAGQVNGTTGYEEAAAQGIMAGINAHLKINEKEPFILNRDDAYIGVLIDDLVNKGVDEPYRMFTSRSEFRILLRQDNADVRLTEKAFIIGLTTIDRFEKLREKTKQVNEIIQFFDEFSVLPKFINEMLFALNTSPINQKTKLQQIVLRPQVSIFDLIESVQPLSDKINDLNILDNEILESAEILMKYSGYIEREKIIAEKIKRLEYIEINEQFDYNKLNSLSTEARQKLSKFKPRSIGQASRISGVSPSDINVLLVFLGR